MIKQKDKLTAFTRVKVDGLFNLQDCAREYGLSAEEVVAFHNKYCPLQDLLTLHLSKYVEYVYLPTTSVSSRKEKLLQNSKLVQPDKISEKNYGVITTFSPKELQLHYQIKVNRNFDHIDLLKQKTYKNNQEIDQTIEQLFEKAEHVLYPLKVATGANGRMRKIINSGDISKRWKEERRPKLAEYYQSETADKILSKLDRAFENIDLKRDLLEKNIFYNLFLLPVYQTYTDFSRKGTLKCYFSQANKWIDYEISFNLNKEFTRGNKIALHLTGAEQETPFNKHSQKGELDLLYKFHRESHEIFSITGWVSAYESQQELKINFQLYELQ